MNTIQAIQALADAGTTVLLLVIMWQGLRRFDRLLDLVIALAARSKLTTDEIEKIRAQVFRGNGTSK
jgi:hypothetical protein